MLLGCETTVREAPLVAKSDNKSLTISNINYDKLTKIVSYSIENKGKLSLFTGCPFVIEKYDEKNGWSKTSLTNNIAFIEIAIVIEEGGIYTDNIDLSKIKKIKDGYYRIVKEYSGENETITQYIQFEVSGNDLIEFQSYNKTN